MFKINNDGAITVEDCDLKVSPETKLESLTKLGEQLDGFEQNVVNLPYISFLLKQKDVEYRFYFYEDNLFEVSVTLFPYDNSTKEQIQKLIDDVLGKENRSFPWGQVKISEDRFAHIFSVVISYQKNEPIR